MPYQITYGSNAQMYTADAWVKASSLRKALSTLVFLDLSTSENCLKGIEIIKDVLDRYEDTPLFSLYTRFPNDGPYIDLNRCDWYSQITALIQLLRIRQFKLKEYEIPPFFELEGFYEIISTCQQKIGAGDALYTRPQFEQVSYSTWKDI
ncbi:hypothetical protein EDC96DRAFT_586685 [Choanephora cucurbitarum]|nr:hypothetical protein EDC96DRAFT_586685 [Choanephora cucurbitarum]